MAQFDVHRLGRGNALVIDCQAELLDQLNTRLVVPLIRSKDAPNPAVRLNPRFVIEGQDYVMVTQFAAAVDRRQLGEVILSLRDHSFEIVGAIDVLISGV